MEHLKFNYDNIAKYILNYAFLLMQAINEKFKVIMWQYWDTP